jgi:hypothetical protein
VCRTGSGDACDPDEKCSGMAMQACPADVIAPNTTVCRAGSGDACDPDEKCTGMATQACPANVVQDNMFVCRASAGSCDIEEKCTGTMGQACPADAVQAQGTMCMGMMTKACTGAGGSDAHCKLATGQTCTMSSDCATNMCVGLCEDVVTMCGSNMDCAGIGGGTCTGLVCQ